VILDPINDQQCLDQLTQIIRELYRTTLIQLMAKRLGSRQAVIDWIRSLPQEDDDGNEPVRYIVCDVPQRVRLLSDTPNCVERATDAALLLEVIDPNRKRALATVDKPLRHTGLVEWDGQHWRALDLFPRRNATRDFSWGDFGKDVLQGVHRYVGKPLLGAYGLGGVADTLGDYEDKAIGRDKKQPEKKPEPPSGSAQRPSGEKREQPKQPQPPKQQASRAERSRTRFDWKQLAGSGANQESGGENGQEGKAKGPRSAGTFGGGGPNEREEAEEGGNGSHRDPHDARNQAKRIWRSFGW
jgi:hypothetical protein